MRNRSRERSWRWVQDLSRTSTVAVVTAAVVLVVVVAVGLRTLGAGSTGGHRPLTVAVLGDSISAGTRLGGLGTANWASLVGAPRGWQVRNVAVGGTGYVYATPGTAPFQAAQLAAAVAARPDLVVVEGSRNDGLIPAAAVGVAASSLYRVLRAQLPGARLVVIGPVWSDGNYNPGLLALRDAVRAAALQAGATFVDPLAEGWFAQPAGLIGPDGVHPNDAGHRVIAARVEQDLDRAAVGTRS